MSYVSLGCLFLADGLSCTSALLIMFISCCGILFGRLHLLSELDCLIDSLVCVLFMTLFSLVAKPLLRFSCTNASPGDIPLWPRRYMVWNEIILHLYVRRTCPSKSFFPSE